MGDTPKWLKKMVRVRMAQTGEKYTKTLRDIKAELEAERLFREEQRRKELDGDAS